MRPGSSRGSELRNARVAALSAGVALLALLWGAAPSWAPHLGLQPCGNLTTHTLRVTTIKSNFPCAHTRSVLRDLLGRGIHGLPKLTTRRGKWGCAKIGSTYICSRYGAAGTTPRRVTFEARRR
jgi:hypothetical protein